MVQDFDAQLGRLIREFSHLQETLALLAIALTWPPRLDPDDDSTHEWMFERIAPVVRDLDPGRLISLIPVLLRDERAGEALRVGWKQVANRVRKVVDARNNHVHSMLPTVTWTDPEGTVHQQVMVDRRGLVEGRTAEQMADFAAEVEVVTGLLGDLFELAYIPQHSADPEPE